MKYLHPDEHEDVIINLLAKQVRANIQCCPFFTVITDTMQDVSKTDQLTQIFRYVSFEKDEKTGLPKEIKINEIF